MIRKLLLSITLVLELTGTAAAGGDAFISLRDAHDESWARDSALQEIFQEKLGFESVDLNNDSPPHQLATNLEAFLSRTGKAGDRRFVWINSPADGPDSACPRNSDFVIAPAVPTLILAPNCFAEYLAPQIDLFHISLRDLPVSPPRGLPDFELRSTPVVYIALPSDRSRIVLDANAIILDTLSQAANGFVSASTILQRLRYELRFDGSNYTPLLDASPASAAWSRRFLAPARPIEAAAPQIATLGGAGFEARLGWPKSTTFGLYSAPEPGTTPALWLTGKSPVTIIRHSRDGGMGFVKTTENLFGWVRLDVLD